MANGQISLENSRIEIFPIPHTTYMIMPTGGVIVPINERFSAEASGFYEDRDTLYVRRGGSVNLIYHW